MSRPYEGPFDAPPAELTKGAIGWRFTKRHVSDTRWEPKGWEIVFPDHVVEFNLAGVGVRDSTLHPVDGATHPLVSVHQLAYPERYGYDADHMYWSDFDPETDDERTFKRDRGVFEWESDTIEWVMAQVEACAVELGVTLADVDPDAGS